MVWNDSNYPFRKPVGDAPVALAAYPAVVLIGRYAYDTARGVGTHLRIRKEGREFWKDLFTSASDAMRTTPDNKVVYHFRVQGHDLYAGWYDNRVTLWTDVEVRR